MKVLVEGTLTKLPRSRRFECPDCGCLFIASMHEYVREQAGDHWVAVCNCPTCKRLVVRSDEPDLTK